MRTELLRVVAQRFRNNPVVMLRGPRQCGKTTLARQFAEGRSSTWFDLEAPADAQRLAHPMTALERLRGTVVIDEAQLLPALFPVLRVLVERRSSPAKFLVLGSASPELASGVSESLAGRVALVPMGGFDLSEMLAAAVRKGAGASLAHIWPARTPRVGSGGWISFKPFSNGICAASVCRSRRRLCADSGRWQLTITGKF